ncbi:MAG: PH domain-containing protein [Opitutaceae bacterium]|nr:PH domain-containing protein [Opitutaceae bacterium]
MNSFQFECPYCQAINDGDEAMKGRRVLCPKCQATMLVPAAPVGPEPRTARLIQKAEVGALVVPGPDSSEAEIFRLTPVARAYPGQILLGVVLLGLGIALAVYAPGPSWPKWVSLVLLLPGMIFLLALWGRVKSSSYRLTTQRLFVRRGWLAKHVNELELYRVKDVVVDQGVLQRLLGFGTITVLADDDSTPGIRLVGVAGPVAVKEMIRSHYRAARQREGVRPTEFLQTP